MKSEYEYKTPKEQRERSRAYYYEHRDRILADQREHVTHEMKLRRAERARADRPKRNKRHNEHRRDILAFLGGKCVRCGIDDYRVLQIDHVNGGGNKEQKQHKNWQAGYSYWKHIKEVNGEGYQLLCANCNWIKRHENGEFQ